MPNENSSDDRLLRAALQRTGDCPSIEALGQAFEAADPLVLQHARSCAACGAELEMLKSFHLADIPAEDAAAVAAITERLKQRPVAEPRAVEAPRKPWWDFRFNGSWLRPAAFAAAGILLVVAIGLQLRHSQSPALRTSVSGPEVYRSGTFRILSPLSDLSSAPGEVRWEAIPAAANYRARLLEVDGNEIWSMETAGTRAEFPPSVKAQIVPAKTLLLQITAFDAQGRKIAESDRGRFRFLQNIYQR